MCEGSMRIKKRLNVNKIKEVWRDEGRERHLVC